MATFSKCRFCKRTIRIASAVHRVCPDCQPKWRTRTVRRGDKRRLNVAVHDELLRRAGSWGEECHTCSVGRGKRALIPDIGPDGSVHGLLCFRCFRAARVIRYYSNIRKWREYLEGEPQFWSDDECIAKRLEGSDG